MLQATNVPVAGILHELLPYSVESPNNQRDLWWKRYGDATGKGYKAMPSDLRKEKLDELTRLPLLNYLVALSYERSLLPPKDGEKRLNFSESLAINEIYRDFLKNIHERVWEKKPRFQTKGANPHAGDLKLSEFIRLLEEIATAAWHHGDLRQAPYAAVTQHCKEAKLTASLDKLKPKLDEALTRLFASFFIKRTPDASDSLDPLQQGTVEFTHKTFGEYLAASRIVRLMEAIGKNRFSDGATPCDPWDSKKALVEWVKLCGPKPLDISDLNLFQLLTDEVRAKDPVAREQWRALYEELAEEMLSHGLPMEQCGLITYTQMDFQARNAEETLLCALSACLSPETEPIKKDPAPKAAPALARWHYRNGINIWPLAAGCLSALRYLGRTFDDSNLTRANLTGANLTGANLTGVTMKRAELTEANLMEALLMGANLTGADMTEGNLMGANLTDATLTEAYLTGANLTRANLTRANLTDADLRDADLTNADLTEATLRGATLTGVRNWQHASGINWAHVAPSNARGI